jgi:hypothetical protein
MRPRLRRIGRRLLSVVCSPAFAVGTGIAAPVGGRAAHAASAARTAERSGDREPAALAGPEGARPLNSSNAARPAGASLTTFHAGRGPELPAPLSIPILPRVNGTPHHAGSPLPGMKLRYDEALRGEERRLPPISLRKPGDPMSDGPQTQEHEDDGATTYSLRVECYAGHRADVAPVRFHIGRRAVEVLDIIDRWLDPMHSYFKLRGNDGGIYILRHDQAVDVWEITLFDSGTRQETRLSST